MRAKQPTMPFGPHKGETIGKIPWQYLEGLTDQPWFEQKYPGLYVVGIIGLAGLKTVFKPLDRSVHPN
jgi:uncharacterized protein (DUF3820 family)